MLPNAAQLVSPVFLEGNITAAMLRAPIAKIVFFAIVPERDMVHWKSTLFFGARVDEAWGLQLDMFVPDAHTHHSSHDTSIPNAYGTLRLRVWTNEAASSRQTILEKEWPFLKAFTLRQVLDLIDESKMMFYKFGVNKQKQTKSGCLFWQLKLLGLVSEKRVIADNAMTRTESAVTALGNHPRYGKVLMLPAHQGNFEGIELAGRKMRASWIDHFIHIYT